MNCQICFENYNDSKTKPYSITPCGHTFCSKCLDNLMITDAAKCPKCRIQIKGKIMNFAILDVIDLNLIPDSNLGLKKAIEKTMNDVHGLETQFFAAYEQKVQENKERIKLLKEEINNQTIELINQIKQNRVHLFKNAEQLEITMNESLLRYLHTEQQIELNVSERTSQLKNLNQYERTELNSFKEQLDKSKHDFDSNIKEMKHFNFKLEFKKFSNNPNINYIGDIIHETPVTKDIKPETIEPMSSIAPIVSIEPKAAMNPSKSENNPRFTASSRASGISKSTLERKREASAPRANLNTQIKPPLSLLATIKGTSRVKALCSLPNGCIASGSRDNIIKIWNPKDSTLLTTLKGHTNSINCLLTLSNDYIASGSTDTTIMIWNTQTGSLSKTLSGHSGFVHALALLFSGNIASGSDDCTVKIWDTVTGMAVKTFKGHTYTVLSLCVLRNGNHLASGSADTNIKIWNTESSSARSIRTLTGHTNSVNCLCLVGDYLASGSNDQTIKMWNTSNGDLLTTLVGHKDYVSSLCSVSHDLLASGSLDNTLKVWNIKNGQLAKNLIDHCDWVTSLVMIRHKYLASGSHDETIKIWSL